MTALIICTVVFAVVALAFLGFAIYDHISWRKANRAQSPNEKSRVESSIPVAEAVSKNAASSVVSNAQDRTPAVPQQFCAGCGNPVSGKFCAVCGTPVPQPSKPVKALSPLVLFVLTCVFGALAVLLYMLSAYIYDVADFHLSIVLSCFALPLLCVYPVAFWVQNKKPVLSGFLYLLPISALFFIAFISFKYKMTFTPILVTLSCAFLIASACTVKKHTETIATPRKPRAAIAVLLCAAVLVSGSGLVLEQISNARRQSYLNDLSELGISLSKEELDIIDPDYVLRRGLKGELGENFLISNDYVLDEKETSENGKPTYILNENSANEYHLPPYAASVIAENECLLSYSVSCFDISRTDARLIETLRILTRASGAGLISTDFNACTINQILDAPAPKATETYIHPSKQSFAYIITLHSDGTVDLYYYITLDKD